MTEPKEFPSDKADKFVVRFPEGMRVRIKVAAETSGRSMNAEITERLQQSLEQDDENKQLIESITSMGRAYQRQEDVIAAQERLIQELAKILRIVIESIKGRSQDFRQTLEHYHQFALAIEAGDISKALPHLEQVIEQGLDAGILNADDHAETKRIAEQRALKKSQPELK